MRETSFRELYFLCLIVWCLTGFYSDVECYPQLDCEENEDYRQSSAVQSSLCGLVWGDQNKVGNKSVCIHYSQEQIQNVFKRVSLCFVFFYHKLQLYPVILSNLLTILSSFQFLFHYSKAQNSVGTVERESHSVHPLMRLSPKFTLRRKKQQLLSVSFISAC
ncbi:hypothetical protein QTP86_029479 [Hemibagrus guttatus]|nr:hypothetical protein QTP86_029479 [Hemibagrus guttatus]